jgi:hypothetical protein
MTTQAYSGLNRPGWLTFAAVVIFAVGSLRAIFGDLLLRRQRQSRQRERRRVW